MKWKFFIFYSFNVKYYNISIHTSYKISMGSGPKISPLGTPLIPTTYTGYVII